MPDFAVNWADAVQAILSVRAPRWSRRLQAADEVEEPQDCVALDSSKSAISGELLRFLRQGQPSGGSSAAAVRLVGERLFKGATEEFSLLLHADEEPLFRSARSGLSLGNHLVLWIDKPTVEGEPAEEWVKKFLLQLVNKVPTWYANGRTSGEFAELNRSGDEIYTRVEGIDLARALPGVYWLNWFGRPWAELIGSERLLSTPAVRCQTADAGVLLAIGESPSSWKLPAYREARDAVIAHIGSEYVYDRRRPQAPTVAPQLESFL